ncbi:MAG: hypothetical protein K9L83_02545 [Deltaproteobacteria bacterium]|nr:hypothetical protein [Deltaproteobacteria bacterium]
MKLINPEDMKKAEAELINAVQSNLDWRAVKAVLRDKHHLKLRENVRTKGAEIRVVDNRITYALNMEVNLAFSIELDREGNLVSLSEKDPGAQVSETPVEHASTKEEPTGESHPDAEIVGEVGDGWAEDVPEAAYEDALKDLGSLERP